MNTQGNDRKNTGILSWSECGNPDSSYQKIDMNEVLFILFRVFILFVKAWILFWQLNFMFILIFFLRLFWFYFLFILSLALVTL